MLIGVKDSQSDLEKHYKTFCEAGRGCLAGAVYIQWCCNYHHKKREGRKGSNKLFIQLFFPKIHRQL